MVQTVKEYQLKQRIKKLERDARAQQRAERFDIRSDRAIRGASNIGNKAIKGIGGVRINTRSATPNVSRAFLESAYKVNGEDLISGR